MKTNPSFFATTIGQTALTSATGVVLYLYVFSHLLGNLLIFSGPGRINAYGIWLHSHPVMLWAARSVLLSAVLIHIATDTKLWWLRRHAARPIPYARRKHVPPGYAS
jgi:succinate dehydrogenase / fumarate reductase cytochrome b subunit